MKIISTKKILFFSILFMFSCSIYGQVTLQGIVTDSLTQEPLIGASVFLVGTSQGAATNFDGEYKIQNIADGNYRLKVSYVGYQSKLIDLPLSGKKTVDLFIQLSTGKIEGKTIVVTAQAQGQLSAINEQLSSNKIINVVSAEKMKELPDANLAESIGRLPGISLQRMNGEAEKVVIRGLSPKYNNVTIEGVAIQSTNYFDRSIDLSLISDDLVKGVEVSKSLRPDMDADALGGTVNLTLKTAQEGLHYDIRGNGGYNQLGKSYENYKFSGSVSNRFFDNQIGVQLQGNIEKKQLPSDQLSAGYDAPQYFKTATDSGFNMKTNNVSLTEGKTTRDRYGISLLLDYASEFVNIKLLNVYDQKKDDVMTRNFQKSFGGSFTDVLSVNDTKTEQRTHSLQALFKLWDTELPISLSYTKGEAGRPNAQVFTFLQTGLPPIPDSRKIFGQPSSLSNSMGYMNPELSTLNNMSVSNTTLLDETYDVKIDWKIPIKFSDSFTGNIIAGGKFHSTSRTSENHQEFDYLLYGLGAGNRNDLIASFDFLTGADNGNSAGIPAKYFVDSGYDRSDILGFSIGPSYDIDRLLNMQNAYYPSRSRANNGLYFENGVANYNQNYKDKEKSIAGYIMGEFNIGSELTIVPGIRFQQHQTDISAYHIIANGSNQNGLAGDLPVLNEVKRTHPNWYPSVNIKYKATENVQIMGAVYRSVSLPSYSDVSPLVIYQTGNSAQPINQVSNPYLNPSTAWNMDLGASLFSNDIGLFSVNLFYKEIDDLIYNLQNYQPFLPFPIVGAPSDILDRLPNRNYFDTTWAKQNSATKAFVSVPMNSPDKAYIRGIELSWQTHLWYLPWVLNGIVLDLNVSLMSSSQSYPYFEQVQTGGTKLKPIYSLFYNTRQAKLQDQPKAIYNAILGWDYMGFSSRFSLRYQQATITSIDTRYSLRDSFYDNLLLIDISLKQQIMNNLSVFVNATNINTHIDKYYLTIPDGTQLPTNQQTYGWNAQFGVSFNY
jgi:TonB-dependent receptor